MLHLKFVLESRLNKGIVTNFEHFNATPNFDIIYGYFGKFYL